MSNPYSGHLLAPSHKSEGLSIINTGPYNTSVTKNQIWNQQTTWSEYEEQNRGHSAWLTNQDANEKSIETIQQMNLPTVLKKSKKHRQKERQRENKGKAQVQQPPHLLQNTAKKEKKVVRTTYVESGPAKARRVQQNEKENKQLSRVLAEMMAYERSKFGFRPIPINTQYPAHTASELLKQDEVEDWSMAINSLQTQRLKQDVENRFLNLTREPVSSIEGIKCEKESDSCEDGSDLEEGEIREFPRPLSNEIKPEPVLEVEPRIKQEPV